MTVTVLGIRHHGPGSARSVVRALNELAPDMILIEGPADADPLIPLAASADLVPPVAILAYRADAPRVSAFWPFAAFSPEWQALRWAADRQVPVRFCDLPSAALFSGGSGAGSGGGSGSEPEEAPADRSAARTDPLARLSEAAGYDDPERWWDDVIESQTAGAPPFEAITEAMVELRNSAGGRSDRRDEVREAHMRQVLRAVLKAGAERVAIVCGAWHAPALTGPLPTAAADTRLLRGLPKVPPQEKMRLTWVPWTHSRLSQESGYGAGIVSPGWYEHLFSAPDQPISRWLTKVARALRTEDLPVSSAHVIEGVRLAEALAVMRGRTLAGLAEVTEATLAVLCEGEEVALDFVTRALVVGEAMGSVPDDAPSVPLAADLATTARRLRLKLEPLARDVTLDLRKAPDLAKSRLLHRVSVLGIQWGELDDELSRGTGTFKEGWTLQWQPEFAVDLIDASVWGNTLVSAASAKLIDLADHATRLGVIAGAVESALTAELPSALDPILTALTTRAALSSDVTQLMSALPPLIRSAQYGDVRGTDAAGLNDVIDAVLLRVCAGFPSAVGALDDDGAAELRRAVDELHAAILLRGTSELVREGRQRWLDTLRGVSERRDLHGLLAGRIVRLLLDASVLTADAAADRLRLALSFGSTVAAKAAWAQGFLSEDGLLLVHNRELLRIVDEWISGLSDADFVDAVALLRRTFGTFASGERRTIGEQARRLGKTAAASGVAVVDFDPVRAAAAVATVAGLLGVAVGVAP